MLFLWFFLYSLLGQYVVGNYPYVTRLVITNPGLKTSKSRLCSGALILQKWVLTTAGCVYKTKPSSIQVYIGDAPAEINETVVSVILNPRYDPKNHLNDLALLELKHSFSKVTPIPMAIYNDEKLLMIQDFEVLDNVTEGAFLSWGGLSVRNRQVKVVLQRVNSKPCVNMKNNQFICSEDVDPKNPVRGDNGGPLLLLVNYLNTPQYLLFGILSFRIDTEIIDSIDNHRKHLYYYVHTYIFYHFDWIQHVIQDNTPSSEVETTFQGIAHLPSRRSENGNQEETADDGVEDEIQGITPPNEMKDDFQSVLDSPSRRSENVNQENNPGYRQLERKFSIVFPTKRALYEDDDYEVEEGATTGSTGSPESTTTGYD